MKFKVDETATKLRGGYYTPADVARFLTKWVLGRDPRTILEPSCGDGAFIRALEKQTNHEVNLTGVEINPEEAQKSILAANGLPWLKTQVITTDFLSFALERLLAGTTFEGALGNPPYIRYQYLEPQSQILSQRIFSRHDLPFTKHTNAWVPFVIASIDLLAPTGRLAMIVPSELLHVLHAGSLRTHLLNECSRILIIDPSELLFESALQGTVLLLAEKASHSPRNKSRIAITSIGSQEFLKRDPEELFERADFVNGETLHGKWMKLLLRAGEIDILEACEKNSFVHRFHELAKVDVGIVTGANGFFLVNERTVQENGLEEFARPMFGRSEHCPGVIYNKSTHERNIELGYPTSFLQFPSVPHKQLIKPAKAYIEAGEAEGIHNRYKCRIRDPWYVVPSIYATNIGMLKRCHHFPRLILNEAKAYTTDTAYRIRVHSTHISDERFVFNFVNSLTALTAELEGRHYGGGVLELVPSEIEKLLVPTPQVPRVNLPNLDKQMRKMSSPEKLLGGQDAIILSGIGLDSDTISTVQAAWNRIRRRRQRHAIEQTADQGSINEY